MFTASKKVLLRHKNRLIILGTLNFQSAYLDFKTFDTFILQITSLQNNSIYFNYFGIIYKKKLCKKWEFGYHFIISKILISQQHFFLSSA